MTSIQDYMIYVDPEQIARERRKGQDLRQSQWWRQQLGRGRCYYCEQKFSREELTMDHVIPLARGGSSTKKNCVVACKACNSAKGTQTMAELAMAKLPTEPLPQED